MTRPRSDLVMQDPFTGCWLWSGTQSWNGYGRVQRNGKLRWAHRIYFEEAKGAIPDGMDLDHLCRTKMCVNPDHLEIVSKAENQRRGKAVRLSWEQVEYIRRRCRPRVRGSSMRALAKELSVTHETVRRVFRDESWLVEGGQ